MDLPEDILQRNGVEIGHRIALGFLAEARAACARLADADDADALHDFRVAIRRLRSTLSTWRGPLRHAIKKKHRRMLRAMQRATGGARDAEVALLWLETIAPEAAPAQAPGIAWVESVLQGDGQAAPDDPRAMVRAAFAEADDVLQARLEQATLKVDLRGREPVMFDGIVVGMLGCVLADELLAHLRAIEGPHAEAEAHEARIRGKRLRYHVEPFAKQVPEAAALVSLCKRLQDVLGDLNDTHVLRAWLAAHAGDAPAQAVDGLAYVQACNEARHEALYATLQSDWLQDGGAALDEAYDAFDARIVALCGLGLEIERKYLLTGAPTLPEAAATQEIEQGYLATEGVAERVRRITTDTGVRYVRTLKFGSGLSRLESEEDIDAAHFEALWALTEGRRVHKRRHVLVEGEHTWEVDEFLDRPLWLAEVELEHETDEVAPPAWLAAVLDRDVTDSGEFSNRRLAR